MGSDSILNGVGVNWDNLVLRARVAVELSRADSDTNGLTRVLRCPATTYAAAGRREECLISAMRGEGPRTKEFTEWQSRANGVRLRFRNGV